MGNSVSTISSTLITQKSNNDEKSAEIQNRFMQSVMHASLSLDKNKIFQPIANLKSEEGSSESETSHIDKSDVRGKNSISVETEGNSFYIFL